ncbi:MAG: ABC transporter ATP-binding protein, partial [Oscillospiraceae bacterium]|nr:ABC transporter ATP-binding protein [Oscillospiraceae bacterium]
MIGTILASLREFKKPTIWTLVLIIGEVFIEVLIPFYTARLVNMIKAGTAMNQVVRLELILVLMAVLSLGCGAAAGIVSARASTGFARNLRRDIFERIQSFSFE